MARRLATNPNNINFNLLAGVLLTKQMLNFRGENILVHDSRAPDLQRMIIFLIVD